MQNTEGKVKGANTRHHSTRIGLGNESDYLSGSSCSLRSDFILNSAILPSSLFSELQGYSLTHAGTNGCLKLDCLILDKTSTWRCFFCNALPMTW